MVLLIFYELSGNAKDKVCFKHVEDSNPERWKEKENIIYNDLRSDRYKFN